MPHTNFHRQAGMVMTGLSLCFLLSCQCTKVTIPQNSTVPPAVVMIAGVENKNDTVTTTPVSEVVRSGDSKIGLIGMAADDQAVGDVQINGEVDTTCISGDIGQLLSATYFADNRDNSQPGSQGCTLRLTGLNATASNRCNSGFTWSGSSGEFTTTGSNFSNVSSTTAVYSFSVVSPPAPALRKKDLLGMTTKACTVKQPKHVKGLKKLSCLEVKLPAPLH